MHSRFLLVLLAAILSSGSAAPRGTLPVATDAEIRLYAADLTSPLPSLRRAAADRLGEIGPRAATAINPLLTALDDSDGLVRAHAAWALGKIPPASDRVIAALARKLEPAETEWPVRHNASLSLSWLGEPAVPALQQVLKNAGGATRAYAVDALLRIDAAKHASTCAPVLRALLADADEQVRAFAASLAGQLGTAGETAVPGLVRLLTDPHLPARLNALQSLPKIGNSARVALPAIEKVVTSDSEQWVRIHAILALGELGPDSPASLAALAAALADSKERVSAYAAQALARIGERAVPALQSALAAEHKFTRMSAADSLAFMGKAAGLHLPAAAAALAGAVQKDQAWEVRSRAATALGVLGDANPRVLAALQASLTDENDIVRLHTRLALEKLGHPAEADTAKPKPRSATSS